jgi:hypothetical protein
MTSRDKTLAWVAGVVAVIVVGVGVAAFVRSRSDDTPAAATTTTTTTTVPGARAALTGLPISAPDDRPALGVKIDETPGVNSYAGLERADLIYELLVEGDITRCMAVYQSQDAPKVGPTRSLRASDFQLVANLGHPIVAFSGGDKYTLQAAKFGDFVPYDPDSKNGDEVFRRDRSLRPPHNLFLSTTGVRENTTGAGAVQSPFTFDAPGSPPPAGLPIAGLRIHYTNFAVASFVWNADRHQWLRWANGKPQVDQDGTQLGVDTVLVMDMTYGNPTWDRNQPLLQSVGEGAGLLLSNGTATAVKWARVAAPSPFTLTRDDGTAVALPPGRTWVALPKAGATSTLDAAAVAQLPAPKAG